MNKPDETYSGRVAHAALGAIIDLYGDEAGQSGVVDPIGATDGLCLAIAMIAHNVGAAKTPSARRALADQCRKRLIEMSNALIAAEQQGALPDWIEAKPITRSS